MSQKILLIDDDREIIEGASMRLRSAGYDTITANDGVQGVAKAIDSDPDAIVLDVRMPNKDGLQALAELKMNETTCDIPIVMLSASLIDQQAALDTGARYFLTKPYQGKDLLAAIDAALDSSRNGCLN